MKLLRGPEPERHLLPVRLGADRLQKLQHLLRCDPLPECHDANLVPVQPVRQLAEDGVLGVGGGPIDDQLVPRDADGQRLAPGQQRAEPVVHGAGGMLNDRMSGRIGAVLVQTNRELNQEDRQLAR